MDVQGEPMVDTHHLVMSHMYRCLIPIAQHTCVEKYSECDECGEPYCKIVGKLEF